MRISEALAIAVTHHQAGRLDLAEEIYRRILAVDPEHAQAWNNLGVALQAAGRSAEASDACRQALRLKPDFPQALDNLGNALQTEGKPAEAESCYRAAIRIRPDHAEAWASLGIVLAAQGKADEAIAAYRQALALSPEHADAQNNLGLALQARGDFPAAEACYRRALELQPRFAEALNNLGGLFKEQADFASALVCLRQAVDVAPGHGGIRSNYLSALPYCAGATLAGLLSAHAEFERHCAAPLRAAWRAHENAPDPERRLRLGFVSADFGWHPVGQLLIRTLENLDRQQCEIVCYCDRKQSDAMTARFQAAAGDWVPSSGLSDAALADRVRADGIDILFDLAGHTHGNRLLVFARKPAPLQIAWIGYPGTTGLAAIDYLLADACEVPPGAESQYTERILRLPDGYVCYDPPADAPPVGPLPALARGSLTFGSFNNPAKITAEVGALWCEILRRTPGSRLILKYPGLDGERTRSRLATLLAGIGPDRVELLAGAPRDRLLGWYNQVDVGLDTFPYSGGLTTCEALWMGVPVVTWPGETFAGRHALSHLTAAGATETIAADAAHYVEIATRLAADLPGLAAIRAGLRPRMAAAPLCDGKRFAANLMAALRQVWRQWCERT